MRVTTVLTGERAATPETAWCLVAGAGQTGAPRHVRVHTTPFTVGRRPEMNLTLSCSSVSGRHAELIFDGEALWVRDLKSTNGTFVNGSAIESATELKPGDYVQFAKVVFRVGQETIMSNSHTQLGASADEALALIQFDKLISQRNVTPFFQPIVSVTDGARVGFEVLARSRLFGLQTPAAMFSAAQVLELEGELSRMCRTEGLVAAGQLHSPRILFLNTHPCELADLAKLGSSLTELRTMYPAQPIALEVHEAAITDDKAMRELSAVLAGLEMLLAYDDFGAGQARFVELVEVPPHYLKFDMKLIQGIHAASAARQQMLATLVHMARDLGIRALAEGVECQAESDTCHQMGFELGQGFHFGRPAPATNFAPGAPGAAREPSGEESSSTMRH
jgi:EAL domain-containing protein (putative c-di-GMP-specific phosphodiesterase class I)